MIDRLFTAVLAFSMLSLGAASFASLAVQAPTVTPRQVQLERVTITAKRLAPDVLAQVEVQSSSVRAIATTITDKINLP